MSQVKVKSLAYFRGLDGEGRNQDGNVQPGDVLTLAGHRAADLRSHRLIEPTDHVEPPAPALVPVVTKKVK